MHWGYFDMLFALANLLPPHTYPLLPGHIKGSDGRHATKAISISWRLSCVPTIASVRPAALQRFVGFHIGLLVF